jgi:hypothetical protein
MSFFDKMQYFNGAKPGSKRKLAEESEERNKKLKNMKKIDRRGSFKLHGKTIGRG